MFAQGDRRRAGVQDRGGGEVRGEHVWVDLGHVHLDVNDVDLTMFILMSMAMTIRMCIACRRRYKQGVPKK